MHLLDSNFESLLETEPEEFARQLLRVHGLPEKPLSASNGWSNQVWLAPAHVVRLSSGRFRDSFAHERDTLRLLPPTVPHAPVRGHGRAGRREWLVQDRASGRPLGEAWSSLSTTQRRSAMLQLGAALRILHAIPLPAGFDNPWLAEAVGPDGHRENAYHVSPEHYQLLLDAALLVPGIDRGLLDECGAFIAERLHLFAEDSPVLAHCDLHFANLLWEGGRLTALLDFEGARPATADTELDTLLRFARETWLYQSPDSATKMGREALSGISDWLAEAYPALFAHPQLPARLAVYEALWQLVQLLHFPRGSGSPDPYGHLKELLRAGDTWEPFSPPALTS